MSISFIRRWSIACILLLAVSCGRHAPETSLVDAHSLPEPASIPRVESAIDLGVTRLGREFEVALPHQGVTAVGNEAEFSVEEDAPGGLAYCMYRFNVFGYDGMLGFYGDWGSGSWGVAWLGVANWKANRWDFTQTVEYEGALDLPGTNEDYIRDDGTVVAAVIYYSEDQAPEPIRLANFRLTHFGIVGTEGPVVIHDVLPQSGSTGSSVVARVIHEGAQPETFAWDFGGGAEPNFSETESPSIVLGPEGVYSASVTITNGQGSKKELFTLTVLPEGNWTRTLGISEYSDRAHCVATDDDGNILVGGKLFVAKLTPAGDPLWIRTVRDPSFQIATNIAAGPNGTVIAGYVCCYGGGGSGVALFDREGELLWAHKTVSYFDGDIHPAADGIYLVALGAKLAKISYDGELMWTKWFAAWDMVVAPDGSIYGCATGSGARARVSKYDAEGEVTWSRTWNIGTYSSNWAHAIDLDPDGNVIVAGELVESASSTGGFLISVSSVGELNFCRRWPRSGAHTGGPTDFTTDVTVSPTGTIFVSYDQVARWEAVTLRNGTLLAFDQAGSHLGSWALHGFNSLLAVDTDTQGNLLLAGSAYNNSVSLAATTIDPGDYSMSTLTETLEPYPVEFELVAVETVAIPVTAVLDEGYGMADALIMKIAELP